ncbi:hypothetical protein RHSIM_Rhsim08G0133200 [Rhododendron simsii]|uniref:Ubiquitin-like protease family profile domain-containing protein n=1 Tax=Rhododendron simsii TaxID=118357 RepID=A0A834LHM0_RHOSS|nr:hypothetical protein RHSIM_Rhsim08G0133200 [Rhododendron simsii]
MSLVLTAICCVDATVVSVMAVVAAATTLLVQSAAKCCSVVLYFLFCQLQFAICYRLFCYHADDIFCCCFCSFTSVDADVCKSKLLIMVLCVNFLASCAVISMMARSKAKARKSIVPPMKVQVKKGAIVHEGSSSQKEQRKPSGFAVYVKDFTQGLKKAFKEDNIIKQTEVMAAISKWWHKGYWQKKYDETYEGSSNEEDNDEEEVNDDKSSQEEGDNYQCDAIKAFNAFHTLLDVKCGHLHRAFVMHLVQCFNPETCSIEFMRGVVVHIAEEDVARVLGMPIGKTPVPTECLESHRNKIEENFNGGFKGIEILKLENVIKEGHTDGRQKELVVIYFDLHPLDVDIGKEPEAPIGLWTKELIDIQISKEEEDKPIEDSIFSQFPPHNLKNQICIDMYEDFMSQFINNYKRLHEMDAAMGEPVIGSPVLQSPQDGPWAHSSNLLHAQSDEFSSVLRDNCDPDKVGYDVLKCDMQKNLFALLKKTRRRSRNDSRIFKVEYADVPQQTNIHDCGIYVMKLVDCWDGRTYPSAERQQGYFEVILWVRGFVLVRGFLISLAASVAALSLVAAFKMDSGVIIMLVGIVLSALLFVLNSSSLLSPPATTVLLVLGLWSVYVLSSADADRLKLLLPTSVVLSGTC